VCVCGGCKVTLDLTRERERERERESVCAPRLGCRWGAYSDFVGCESDEWGFGGDELPPFATPAQPPRTRFELEPVRGTIMSREIGGRRETAA
jgi:hypothetical protein